MGRWAQQRKRGSIGHKLEGLQAPPAPIIALVGDSLKQSAQGGADTGGTVSLYRSPDGLAPFELQSVDAWESSYDWGTSEDIGHGVYRATETGNGFAYFGESQPSNTIVM
jgi:hypothetical protein